MPHHGRQVSNDLPHFPMSGCFGRDGEESPVDEGEMQRHVAHVMMMSRGRPS